MQVNEFQDRHIGPKENDIDEMLQLLGYQTLEGFIQTVVPKEIQTKTALDLQPKAEHAALAELSQLASQNETWRSYIGLGYYDTITPAVIRRNILENPGWYTQYTPYQAEIAQGRLEALLNFQTMISDLTALPIANASLLDEATAAAEAMAMCFAFAERDLEKVFFVSDQCHPQTIAVIQTRAEPLGIQVEVGDFKRLNSNVRLMGACVQYPTTEGKIEDYGRFAEQVHAQGGLLVVAADILSLALLRPPGAFGADIAVGSTQRFGVPMGYGGPHAAFLATRDEFKRMIPGRIVGVSQDSRGQLAVRLALQTREQHIRREKATSNICTAQVLLAVMASMYAVYHGPKGLRDIALRTHEMAVIMAEQLRSAGYKIRHQDFFDTLFIETSDSTRSVHEIRHAAIQNKLNLRYINEKSLIIAFDEVTTLKDIEILCAIFGVANCSVKPLMLRAFRGSVEFQRQDEILKHPIFSMHHSETELLRYIKRLESKDLSLTTSMIPLGSCTMKLNASAEMLPVTWSQFSSIHPFVPLEQVQGYQRLFRDLETWLAQLTGFAAVSLQPNAGSQGEYAGLLVIRKYLQSKGAGHRNVCLIPQSAHGTNPATAVMAGMQVVVVKCDEEGNIDVEDLRVKAKEHQQNLAALMITYPSTHGVFEEGIQDICALIHECGGQVYMDGANMNAQVGLCHPSACGADVCHLNLHKTFCIPHGGGGPGVGPIGVAAHLVPFLPSHPVVKMPQSTEQSIGPISAAPWGSASILSIPWMYITMMGEVGLTRATQVAILNANYIAKRLQDFFPVLFKGKKGLVAHECIIDLRPFKASAGVEVEDVAKRLMDYGFHAPTVSWPVAGTMMIEPTESESKAELDRFCDALIAIRKEIEAIEAGRMDSKNNVLKNAPHPATLCIQSEWPYPYSREQAAYPAPWLKQYKFWPAVSRINNVLGDRQLVCNCPSIEEYGSY